MQGFDSKKRADSREEFWLVDRLREKIVRSGFGPVDSFLSRVKRGYHDDREQGCVGLLSDSLADLITAHLRHSYVQKNQIRSVPVQLIEGLVTRRGLNCEISIVLEQVGQQGDIRRCIINDKDFGPPCFHVHRASLVYRYDCHLVGWLRVC